MKKIISIILVSIILISFPSKANAIPNGIGLTPGQRHPNWKKQYEYITSNSCKAVGVIPYNGDVYYTCPDGQDFWSEIMTPIPDLPLSAYMKNKAKQDSDDAQDNMNDTSATSLIPIPIVDTKQLLF